MHEFTTAQTNEGNEIIMPAWLFEVKKKIVLLEISYYLKNGSSSKQLIKKFDKFTNDTFDVRIKWLTKKVKTLFRLKDKFQQQACKIYEVVCSCDESYISETIRNAKVCWDEHNNPIKKSNPSKHTKIILIMFLIGQCWLILQRTCFNWSVLANAPKNMF